MLLNTALQIAESSDETMALLGIVITAVGVLVWTIKRTFAFAEKVTVSSDKIATTMENHLSKIAGNQEKITEVLTKIVNRLETWEERRETGTLEGPKG